ncbi:MAG: hypothetical protein U9P00_13915 [Pseudomonadota bacterium]|nr:hypothetical protein [Pseudomonadota bacterium]
MLFSCSGAVPSERDQYDYMGEWCAGTGVVDNRGNQLDWMRFFWDLGKSGLDFKDVVAIYVESKPLKWKAKGRGEGKTYPNDEHDRPDLTLAPEREQQLITVMAQAIVAVLQSARCGRKLHIPTVARAARRPVSTAASVIRLC